MVHINNRLIEQLASGMEEAVDIDSLAQRITLDVIGQVQIAGSAMHMQIPSKGLVLI